MKKVISISFIALIVINFQTIQISAEEKDEPLYTAYNIWKYPNDRHMHCITYKSAPEFIPAGTRVYDAGVYEKVRSSNREVPIHVQNEKSYKFKY